MNYRPITGRRSEICHSWPKKVLKSKLKVELYLWNGNSLYTNSGMNRS